jgi:H+/gluconate symporter-like permease
MGKIYETTGAAKKIGEVLADKLGAGKAILAVMASSAILTYGGITSFVIIFAIYPIALVLFEKADIPNRLIPATVCLGTWAFAMTGPASTQIQNVIPMQALGTSSMAGWQIGVPAAIIMAVGGYYYLVRKSYELKSKGLHFIQPSNLVAIEDNSLSDKPNFLIAMLPIVFVIVSFNVFKLNILTCLLITDIIATILFIKFFSKDNRFSFASSWSNGAAGCIPIIMSVACIVGYGNVSKLTPFFNWFNNTIMLEADINPYALSFMLANAFAGILGSSSGSLGIVYTTFTDTFLQFGKDGFDLGFIHRLTSIGAGGLDSLPFNGAMISVLVVCGVTHKEGYIPIWWVNGLIPIIAGTAALFIAIIIG